MRERISRLANGYIENEVPRAVFQPELVEEELITDKWSGAFSIVSDNHVQMKGIVYSDDPRIRVIRPQFKGYDAQIPFQVTLRPDEDVREFSGAFAVIGNGFELSVPYRFTVRGQEALRGEAKFATVEEFAQFVKENPEAGERLFGGRGFYDQPFMKDLAVASRCEALTSRGNRKNALEEFLVGCGAKEQVRFSVFDSARTYQMPHAEFSDAIRIERSGWGYFTLDLTTDAPFVILEKDVLTEADFDGNVCQVPYKIRTDLLRDGVNRGKIRIRSPYQSFEVGISCSLSTYRPETNRETLERQKAAVDFTRQHVAYLAGTRTSDSDLENLQTGIARLRALAPDSLQYRLIHAHIYVLQRKEELAGVILDEIYGPVYDLRDQDPGLYCYYLYVRYLLEQQPEQKEVLLTLLSDFESRGRGRGILFFLVRLAVERRITEDSVYFLQEVRREYDAGCRSPYLYMALCLKYRKVPELLSVMDDVSLQALSWGSQNGLVGLSLSRQTASLAAAEKGYRPVYARLLRRLYGLYSQPEVLSAVCTLLMKGGIQTPESFVWYERGVKADLRLTQLYEYYLCTRPENCADPLPASLLGYFAYQHSLGPKAKISLYRYILSHYKPGDREYDAYRGQMEQFAMSEALRGEVDEDLAYLYSRLLYPEMVDEKLAAVLPRILYTHRIVARSGAAQTVVLRYEESKEEHSAAVRSGVAYLPIYGDHYQLLFQDAEGNRYMGYKAEAEPLMKKEPLLSACQALVRPRREELLARCRDIYDRGVYTRQDVDTFRETALDPSVSRVFKSQLTSAVISWIHERGEEAVFDRDYLDMETANLPITDRILRTESLIDRGYDKEAWREVERIGYAKLDPARAMHLVQSRIESGARDALLTKMARDLFAQGEISADLLTYLCENEEGSADDLLAVWRAARRGGAETGDMEEKLLAQLLFTGRYDAAAEVFTAYAQKGTVDALLARAYFTVLCYRYFLEDEEIGEASLAHIERHASLEEDPADLPVIHRLALTKYYYGAFVLTDDQQELGRSLLTSLVQEGYVFAYMKPLSRKLGMQMKLQNRQIIEYRGKKGDRLQLRFRVLPDQEEFAEETMTHAYEGIFVRQLMAFEGDTVEYEIYRKDGDEREKVAADRIFVETEESQGVYGRVGRMNQLLRLQRGGDEMALRRGMEEYGVRETMTQTWFPLKK
ncbi:MAG: hypothetical protein IJL66_03415 [Lachnospiraceae bacterium]|nr:hypothetical protein [Lachnospiraceae bacterium]